MRRASPLLALLFVLACYKSGDDASVAQAGAPADAAAARTAIEAQLGRFRDAMLKNDTAAVGSVYTADAMVLPSGQPLVRGRPAITTAFAGMLAQMPVTRMEFQIIDVTVAGDHAIETGTYSMSMKPRTGKAIDDTGKYVAVWKKDADGSWKMVRDIWNSDKPGA